MPTVKNYFIDAIDDIDDKAIIQSLPTKVIKALGDVQETGFDLRTNQRELFCENGEVNYKLGTRFITAILDEEPSPSKDD